MRKSEATHLLEKSGERILKAAQPLFELMHDYTCKNSPSCGSNQLAAYLASATVIDLKLAVALSVCLPDLFSLIEFDASDIEYTQMLSGEFWEKKHTIDIAPHYPAYLLLALTRAKYGDKLDYVICKIINSRFPLNLIDKLDVECAPMSEEI